MQYLVESIGAAFTKSDAQALAKRFDTRAASGFVFHSVFKVAQPAGCLFGQPTITYLAVYVKDPLHRSPPPLPPSPEMSTLPPLPPLQMP